MVRRNIAICLAIIIFAVAGFVIMFNYGNPLSEMWAKNAAKERIAKKYPKKDFYITGVFYNKEKENLWSKKIEKDKSKGFGRD